MTETGAYSCGSLSGALVMRRSSVRICSASPFCQNQFPARIKPRGACPRRTNLTMPICYSQMMGVAPSDPMNHSLRSGSRRRRGRVQIPCLLTKATIVDTVIIVLTAIER